MYIDCFITEFWILKPYWSAPQCKRNVPQPQTRHHSGRNPLRFPRKGNITESNICSFSLHHKLPQTQPGVPFLNTQA